jgi:hypothetical protein
MVASLRALLTGVVDYAGLFPPARLSLSEAVKRYAEYRGSRECWMLGRFICPSGQLEEMARLLSRLRQPDLPWPVSVLAARKDGAEQIAEGWTLDFHSLWLVGDSARASLRFESLEAPLLPPPFSPLLGVEQLNSMVNKLKRGQELERYYEIHWDARALAAINELATGIGETNATRQPGNRPLGLKLRCGGTEAAAFPSAEYLATAVVACRDGGVPLKATAGLHHAVRRFDPGLQVMMHGFLNLFVAGVLAHARQLNEEQVCRVLLEEDAAAFRFDDEGLSWRDQRATTNEVTLARRRLMTSFGSCSFDEPRDDLRALGLLP